MISTVKSLILRALYVVTEICRIRYRSIMNFKFCIMKVFHENDNTRDHYLRFPNQCDRYYVKVK